MVRFPIFEYEISQIPVAGDGDFVGSLTDNQLFSKLCENPALKELPVKHIMEAAFPIVKGETSISDISKLFQDGAKAVLVNYEKDKYHIITQQDMIKAIA